MVTILYDIERYFKWKIDRLSLLTNEIGYINCLKLQKVNQLAYIGIQCQLIGCYTTRYLEQELNIQKPICLKGQLLQL